MLIADVVFFTLSDLIGFSIIPIIVAVVLIEGGILWLYNRSSSWYDCNFCSILMNYVSAVIGYFLPEKLGVAWYFVLVHSEKMRNNLIDSDNRLSFGLLIGMAFLQGWLISVIIELLTVLSMKKILGVPRIAVPVIIGNTVSYIFLLVCYCFFVL